MSRTSPEGPGELAAAIAAAREQMIAFGKDSQATGKEAKAVFTDIGDMAMQQIAGVAAGAFDAYADAIDKAISAHEFSAKSFGKALRNMLSDTLKSLGQQATVKAAFQVAEGVSMLADPITAGLAAGHFVAAAEWVGVAALAGAAAGALSTGGKSGSSAPNSADSGGNGQAAVRQDVTLVGVLDTAGAEALHEQLMQAAEKRDLA